MPARAGFILLCAALLTAANAVKPIQNDDSSYVAIAAAIAEHPADPYNFSLVFGMQSVRGNNVLAPPFLLYDLAAGMALGGDDPVWLKLWLFPFAVLLAAAMHRLLSRFASAFANPLAVFLLFSPAVLPGWNLMLDVPALALGLTGAALFLDGADRREWRRILLAGLIAGLAMQTKYTWFLLPLLFCAYGLQQRRLGMAFAAGFLAISLFIAWELYLLAVQGESHFLVNLRSRPGTVERAAQNLKAMVPHFGGLFAAGIPLTLLALGRRPRTALSAAGFIVLGYVLLAAVPWAPMKNFVYIPLGLCAWGLVIAVACRATHWRSPAAFLVAWLLLDIATAAVMSPFPAARRWLGTVVVATLLAGHLAAPIRRMHLWRVAVFSIVLGLLHAVVDTADAWCQRLAVDRAMVQARGRVWHFSWTGVQYYATRSGAKPYLPGVSVPAVGDTLLVPDFPCQPGWVLDLSRMDVVERIEMNDGLPFRTVLCYYAGRAPLEHHRGPRVVLTVYRVRE